MISNNENFTVFLNEEILVFQKVFIINALLLYIKDRFLFTVHERAWIFLLFEAFEDMELRVIKQAQNLPIFLILYFNNIVYKLGVFNFEIQKLFGQNVKKHHF